MTLALVLVALAVLVVWCVARAADGRVRRVPDSERLTRRQRRALATATRDLNRKHRLTLVPTEKKQ